MSESLIASARYSWASSPTAEALIRSGRSLETRVTSAPSLARLRATARIRVSLSPSRKPEGSDAGSVWLSSTRIDAAGVTDRDRLVEAAVLDPHLVQHPQRGAREEAQLGMVTLALQLGDHDHREDHLVLVEPAYGAGVGQQDAGVEDIGADGRSGALTLRGHGTHPHSRHAHSRPALDHAVGPGESRGPERRTSPRAPRWRRCVAVVNEHVRALLVRRASPLPDEPEITPATPLFRDDTPERGVNGSPTSRPTPTGRPPAGPPGPGTASRRRSRGRPRRRSGSTAGRRRARHRSRGAGRAARTRPRSTAVRTSWPTPSTSSDSNGETGKMPVVEVRREERRLDVVAREAPRHLGEVVGAEREELGHLRDLTGGHRGPRQLDHGADRNGTSTPVSRCTASATADELGPHERQLPHRRDQRDHDLRPRRRRRP